MFFDIKLKLYTNIKQYSFLNSLKCCGSLSTQTLLPRHAHIYIVKHWRSLTMIFEFWHCRYAMLDLTEIVGTFELHSDDNNY
jgi:hypothetical protein